MRRLYFVMPGVETAKRVVGEFLLARVEERYIHVVAKEGTPIENLPEAGHVEKSNLIPALQRGIAIGGATGLLAGLVAVAFPPAGLIFGGGPLLATTLASAGIGGWLSAIIGSGVPNTRIEGFRKAIEQGKLLMMVDIDKERIDEITGLVKKCCPDVEIYEDEFEIYEDESAIPSSP